MWTKKKMKQKPLIGFHNCEAQGVAVGVVFFFPLAVLDLGAQTSLGPLSVGFLGRQPVPG